LKLAQTNLSEKRATLALTPALSPEERENPAPSPEISRGGIRAASTVSLTPWLQPGVQSSAATVNRFNGLSRASQAVETAEKFFAEPGHRAKAAVSMKGYAHNSGRTASAPASWSAPALWRFDHDKKAAEGCRTTRPRGVLSVSLTPWLQPGVQSRAATVNRFNGLSRASQAVETAGKNFTPAKHRAKATVSMKGPA